MKNMTLLLILFTCAWASAQSLPLQVIGTAGTVFQAGDYILGYTVGEGAITTLAATDGQSLHQGFWQSHYSATSDVVEIGGVDVDIIVAPNPTAGVFGVIIKDGLPIGLRIILYDLLGRVLEESFADPGTEHIEMGGSHLANGLYYLNLQSSEGITVRTFVVQKAD